MVSTGRSGAVAHGSIIWHSDLAAPPPLQRAVVAIGNFDGMHRGHRQLVATVRSAATARNVKSAVLTFDPHPRAFFQPGVPVFRLTPQPVKEKILAAFGIDIVFVRGFDAALAAMSPKAFVRDLLGRDLMASAIVVGTNFRFGRGREGTPEMLHRLAEEAGLGCTIVPPVTFGAGDVSSSRIRASLAAGDVGTANDLLGYRWFVQGEIVHGEKRGRDLGFPTANMRLEPGCELRHGIYAVRVALPGGTVRDGVASFGRRPTFDDGPPLLETFLFDFAGDLYGQRVEIEFVNWIRGEQRFDSADALVRRMQADAAEAREVLARAAAPEIISLIG